MLILHPLPCWEFLNLWLDGIWGFPILIKSVVTRPVWRAQCCQDTEMQDTPSVRTHTHTQFMIQGSTRSVSQEKNQKSHGNAEEEDGVPAWGKQSRYYIKTMMFSSALMRKVFSMIQGLKDFSPILNSCSIDGLHYLLLPLMMMMIRNWLCLLSTHYMPETFMIMNTLYILMIHLTLTSA